METKYKHYFRKKISLHNSFTIDFYNKVITQRKGEGNEKNAYVIDCGSDGVIVRFGGFC